MNKIQELESRLKDRETSLLQLTELRKKEEAEIKSLREEIKREKDRHYLQQGHFVVFLQDTKVKVGILKEHTYLAGSIGYVLASDVHEETFVVTDLHKKVKEGRVRWDQVRKAEYREVKKELLRPIFEAAGRRVFEYRTGDIVASDLNGRLLVYRENREDSLKRQETCLYGYEDSFAFSDYALTPVCFVENRLAEKPRHVQNKR
ncbi:hypothetical protein ACFYKX_10725 [Cytobacillus sp. FJAT-54145]|uniref:Uncharacterized protein n=1 Tax=Cytobacillus spartinae TaxID=3299023 RepID=A0ABW6KA22_9BACI